MCTDLAIAEAEERKNYNKHIIWKYIMSHEHWKKDGHISKALSLSLTCFPVFSLFLPWYLVFFLSFFPLSFLPFSFSHRWMTSQTRLLFCSFERYLSGIYLNQHFFNKKALMQLVAHDQFAAYNLLHWQVLYLRITFCWNHLLSSTKNIFLIDRILCL